MQRSRELLLKTNDENHSSSPSAYPPCIYRDAAVEIIHQRWLQSSLHFGSPFFLPPSLSRKVSLHAINPDYTVIYTRTRLTHNINEATINDVTMCASPISHNPISENTHRILYSPAITSPFLANDAVITCNEGVCACF